MAMYIVAIAWLYVAALVALSETSVIAGVITFIFNGLLPVLLILWLGGTRARRRKGQTGSRQEGPPSPPPTVTPD